MKKKNKNRKNQKKEKTDTELIGQDLSLSALERIRRVKGEEETKNNIITDNQIHDSIERQPIGDKIKENNITGLSSTPLQDEITLTSLIVDNRIMNHKIESYKIIYDKIEELKKWVYDNLDSNKNIILGYLLAAIVAFIIAIISK